MGIEIDKSGVNVDAKTTDNELFNLYGYIDDWGINLSISIGDFSVELNEEYLWLAFRGFLTGKVTKGEFTDYRGDSFIINENTMQIVNISAIDKEKEYSKIVNKYNLVHDYWCAEDENRLLSLIKYLISSGDNLFYSKVLTDYEFLVKLKKAKEMRQIQEQNDFEMSYFSKDRLLKRHDYSSLKNIKKEDDLDKLLKDNLNRVYWLGLNYETQEFKVWQHELPTMLDFILGIKEYKIEDDYSIFGFITQNNITWFVEYPPNGKVIPIKKLTLEDILNIKTKLK